jgi:hypothetical protein
LSVQPNYREYGNNSVTLSVNLGTIGYPTRYSVRFYTEYNDSFADSTFIQAIPPHLNIVDIRWPSPYNMIAGDDAYVPVQINSTDLEPGRLSLSDPGNGKVHLIFDTPNITLPQPNAIVKMRLTGTQNLDSGPHQITVKREFHNKDGLILTGLTKPDNFTIHIIPKTPLDPFVIFLNNAGYAAPVIVIVIITIIAILGPELYRRKIRPYIRRTQENVQGGLKASDMLAVDGSVITGVLVLLSLTQKTTINQIITTLDIAQILGQSLFTTLTATIVYPFAVSDSRSNRK